MWNKIWNSKSLLLFALVAFPFICFLHSFLSFKINCLRDRFIHMCLSIFNTFIHMIEKRASAINKNATWQQNKNDLWTIHLRPLFVFVSFFLRCPWKEGPMKHIVGQMFEINILVQLQVKLTISINFSAQRIFKNLSFFFFSFFCVANLIALTQGCTIGWVSTTLPKLASKDTPLLLSGPVTNDQLSWIGSINCIGCILGSVLVGYLTDVLGAKRTTHLLAVPFAVSWLLIYSGNMYHHILIARFVKRFIRRFRFIWFFLLSSIHVIPEGSSVESLVLALRALFFCM